MARTGAVELRGAFAGGPHAVILPRGGMRLAEARHEWRAAADEDDDHEQDHAVERAWFTFRLHVTSRATPVYTRKEASRQLPEAESDDEQQMLKRNGPIRNISDNGRHDEDPKGEFHSHE